MKKNQWQTLSSKLKFEGDYYKIYSDIVQRPDGSIGKYELVSRDDFVMIIPEYKGKLCLVEQYRYSVRARSWEFPQGGGDKISNPQDVAREELLEETGLIAEELVLLGKLWLAAGTHTQTCNVFLAKCITKKRKHLDKNEADLISKSFTKKAIKKMISDGKIQASLVIAAFYLYLTKNTDI